ncbi:MAG: LysR family transcriptional regulator [Myxococcales bacterium]
MQSANTSNAGHVSWDDYRILEATARTRSFQSAAQSLGIATSTVSRRVAALERRLGVRLVERRPHGVVLTSSGRLLAGAASSMEAMMQRAEHGVANLDSRLSGRVRLTAGEGFGDALVPVVAEFRALYPQIDLELAIDTRIYDLSRGEADLAIRVPRPRERGLRVSKLGSLRFGLFASADYVKRRGLPRNVGDLDAHDFVGFAGSLVDMLPARFLADLAVERFAVRVNSTPLVRQSVALHLGIGVLVTTTSGLVRVLPDRATAPLDVWLVRHASTQGVRRVDCLAAFLRSRLAQLARD